ncbi:prominin-like protein isoform X2 [Condylostylus longicornis]|uniref:prominin-like protein isoform X2 n=1 Tax=Condylostylus longicornis TaxID=2530218 RepID=UPI00244E57C6|nr:prominin-like protein isoform X2 [Condylostylus longicornis]
MKLLKMQKKQSKIQQQQKHQQQNGEHLQQNQQQQNNILTSKIFQQKNYNKLIKNYDNNELNLVNNHNNNNKINNKKIIFNLIERKKFIIMPKLNLLLTFITALVLLSMPTIINATDLQEENLVEYEDIKLSTLNKNVTYASSTKYYLRGMGPLYNATNQILDWFIGKEAIPEDYIVVTEGNIQFGSKVHNNDWGDLLKHYWAILLVIVITALLVVLMPIIGLCFCCCRCAGSCGGRSQPFDKKHDTCRRVFLGLLLICVTTGILFGVVVTFATNTYIQEGIDTSTTTVRKGTQDLQKYLKATTQEVDYLLVHNYDQLSNQLQNVLKNTSDVVINELEETSRAVSLTHLTAFVKTFPEIQSNLERMKTITNELRVNASQLSDGLRGVKRELLQSLNKCNVKDCKDVMRNYQIGKLDANGIDYNQLPDVTNIIQSVQELVNSDVANAVTNGNKAINEMKTSLNDAIMTNIPKVNDAVTKAGDAIKQLSNQLANYMDTMSNVIGNKTDYYTYEADKYLDEYSIYRFYIGVAISSVLLLVLCALTVALLCGICGKRPDGYGDDCCNKGSGARFLMLAISVIFLTISVLAAATLIHFLAGLILHRGVCVPLNNPDSDQIFQYIDNYVDLNKLFNQNVQSKNKNGRNFQNTGALPPFRISNVIIDCQKNKTIYDVLRTQNYIDIEHIKEYPNDYGIYKTLENLKEQIKIDTDRFVMLNKTDKEKIEKLKNSQLKNFDADKFVDNLEKNITLHDLNEIAIKLRQTAENIKSNSKMMDVEVSLKNQALHLETYQHNLVQPMRDHSKELSQLALNLQKNLKLKDKPFDDSINEILKEIEHAQNYIRDHGENFVRKEAVKLAQFFKNQIQKYLEFVINAIEKEIGKCAPIANVYASGVVLGCNKIVDPLNGFWAGLGWCVMLFLPTLVISIKLSSLYQKSDPYPGPLVESEYLYDAYSERDNIPLANGPKNKRRKKDRSRGSRDRRGDYYEESGSSHGQVGTGGRDTRYNDMAPKHWDGGPPRYTNPPMAPPASEYERPPPYYYPGASEQE